MTKPARKRPRPLVLMLALGIATFVALGLAELVARVFVPEARALGAIGYADGAGKPVKDYVEGVKLGLIVPVPGPKPRKHRYMFAPGKAFYITYADNDVLKRDWLDEQGRVINRINFDGLREREEIQHAKPAGQRRIVCIGDSFTFSWGIPVEQGWVRMLEDDLRKDQGDVRTVNCGASGTVCVDEYVNGLKQRFHKYSPDAVILTLCLNDLLPSSGLNFIHPVEQTGIKLIDLAKGAFGRSPLDLDPTRDWVQELMDLPEDQARAGLYVGPDKPYEAMWSQGLPQKCMREAQAWCTERKIPFLVVIWPFLQGLGPGEHYPWQKIHDLVAADLKAADIPLLDVLPALKETHSADLWVTPADPHPNPLAQRLTLPSIADFVRSHIVW
ncbi:MAG: lysophospholipase L1-like esterase [Planctomycetota bacterium]|jgi:lysophospholipase L1-like esterase